MELITLWTIVRAANLIRAGKGSQCRDLNGGARFVLYGWIENQQQHASGII